MPRKNNGMSGHTYVKDGLGILACATLNSVRPGDSDEEDCHQAAYLEGLVEHRRAESADSHTSNEILLKAMQRAMYREIRHSRPAQEQGDDFVDLVELKDFLEVNLKRLPEDQQRAVLAWANGMTAVELAVGEGVSARQMQRTVKAGVDRLRQLAAAA